MCPPGVDQTMRSAQQWSLLAPEIRQAHHYFTSNNYEDRALWGLSNIFFNPEVSWLAWLNLARPAASIKSFQSKFNTQRTSSIQSSGLYSLSPELLDMIIEYLMPEKTDAIAFALSSTFIWQAVLHHIHASYLKSIGSWAGTKIAFQGSYSNQLPSAFTEGGQHEKIMGNHRFGRICDTRRFFWKHRRYGNVNNIHEDSDSWILAAKTQQENSGINKKTWEEIEQELKCPSYDELFPQDRTWVLRNLSNKEIVLSDALLPKGKKRLTFDDVLLMRICWTTVPTPGEENFPHNGAWTGHKFDIVTLEAHEAESGQYWKDVSDVAVKEALKLWAEMRKKGQVFEKSYYDMMDELLCCFTKGLRFYWDKKRNEFLMTKGICLRFGNSSNWDLDLG